MIGTARRAGMLVPLFSVYSKNSSGIGDLEDIRLIADLCEKTGCSILQLLPMNEIGATFCPYDAISSFAIEPSYISLGAIKSAKEKALNARISKIRKEFPSGARHVDYAVKEAKREALWEIFKSRASAEDKGFKDFARDNRYWLDDFALYKAIKNHHAGRPWYEWEEGYAYRDQDALDSFRKEHAEEIIFHKWVQHIAFRQFAAAKTYASSKGILIKGDLPILISRDSADVWAHREFFKLDFASGAPPDMYCAKGQRWGMPTYNLDAIASDGYSYYAAKLKYAENFYDILRIDHAVGFFRIWSIPYNEPIENEGLNGVFDPADEKAWEEHGRRLLSMMLESTGMLLCAEDLGIIPKVCPETLKEFGIPGNEVQRWVKDWEVSHDFLPPEKYRAAAVAMLSTHDTTNWPAWWENEAGTVDEALFVRKCRERGIDYSSAAGKLFDRARSRHGRLRWLPSVSSADILSAALGKGRDEVKDFIGMYENTYREKEKLWDRLGLKGKMRERSDADIVRAALGVTLGSRSVFCIELLMDYLYACGIFKGDHYDNRINRPGTVSKTNWSITIPMALEDLMDHESCGTIKGLISSSGRTADGR